MIIDKDDYMIPLKDDDMDMEATCEQLDICPVCCDAGPIEDEETGAVYDCPRCRGTGRYFCSRGE